VLYVRPLPSAPIPAPEVTIALERSRDQIAEQLRALLDDNAPRLGLDVELVVREGNPYTELIRIADERKVDAIVVGASAQAGHRLVGSLASKLVRRASWPVTVVP
jgi:nucleotide-binding universal stress UspA family protein